MTRQLQVVGAVIISDGRVLCAQRGPHGLLPGLWEFPGGKVDPGETPQLALEREIHEELTCWVSVGDEVTTTTHEYHFATVTLTTFYCTLVSGTPDATEHAALAWVAPAELDMLDWAPADLPAVERIIDVLAR